MRLRWNAILQCPVRSLHRRTICLKLNVTMRRVLLALSGAVAAAVTGFAYAMHNNLLARWELFAPTVPEVLGYVVNTDGCKIPDFNPFDPSIYPHYEQVAPYNCTTKRRSFIRRQGNVLLLDVHMFVKYYNADPTKLRCSYRAITSNFSAEAPDFVVVFSRSYPLDFGVPFREEHVEVECKYNGTMMHKEFFMLPSIKAKVERRCNRTARRLSNDADPLNVVILGLDGVSRLNSLRHLQRTRRYLEETFQPIELYGMTKVGDNSFPNQLAMLTGHAENEEREVCEESYFDDDDLIWRTYSELGYRTMFLEESPSAGLFTYFCRGFRYRSTDYYPRPFIQMVERTGRWNISHRGQFCVGSKDQTSFYLDYTSSLLALLGNRSYFTYTWISDVSHDHLNSAGYADVPFLETFRTLSRTGVMNRSLVVFLSDHGQRYGGIRSTLLGKYEERLPFCILLFPTFFRRKYPEVMKNLAINQRRLTTPFDVHATLLELAHFPRSLGDAEYRTRLGSSLLHEIPENRTCTDASIPPHYCCCHDAEPLGVTNPLSVQMGEFLLGAVNARLSKELPGKCAPHKLRKVTDVQKVTGGSRGIAYFWVTVDTLSRMATIEGTVGLMGAGNFTLDNVSRLNNVGNQSFCFNSHFTLLFCICL